MKLLIVAAVLGMACAGRLENTYLPPSNAASAGGAGAGLSGPVGGGYSGNGAGAGSFGSAGAASAPVAITKYSNENNGDGSYAYSYETADGTSAQESGSLRDADTLVAQGSYSFTGSDGVTYTVTYIADENGFRAEGAHLPTPPPIPEAIQRSLDFIAAEEAKKAKSAPAGGAGGNGFSAGGSAAGNGYPSGGPAGGADGYSYPAPGK